MKRVFAESDRPESIHVRADDIVGESATIHIQPVIRADRAEMRVLDRAVLQAAAGRGVCSEKQTVPELSVQATEDIGVSGSPFKTLWRVDRKRSAASGSVASTMTPGSTVRSPPGKSVVG